MIKDGWVHYMTGAEVHQINREIQLNSLNIYTFVVLIKCV